MPAARTNVASYNNLLLLLVIQRNMQMKFSLRASMHDVFDIESAFATKSLNSVA